MTIFFDGHDFHYEIEGVCKLFFPLIRFTHCFEPFSDLNEDYILTMRKEKAENTLLSVFVRLGEKQRESRFSISPDHAEYEKECERLLCVLLYQILSEMLCVSPSWGILTGVRPVNIIQKERAAGRTDEEIFSHLKRDYLVSDEKLSLAFQTANIQKKLLMSLPRKSFSLYISIPFCKSRCSYCSFVSHAITTKKSMDKVEDYLSLLCVEIAETAKLARELNLTLDTIYIGGGTPTALSAEQLKQVTDAIADNFDVSKAREYTIEAGRADTITPEKLAVIKAAGACRISVNPQSFCDTVLQAIGRKHTAEQAREAYTLSRSYGFRAINMDFIAGLPKDSFESFCETIRQAIELDPENITVHTLSIKRSADLFSAEGIREYVKTDITNRMTAFAHKTLIENGYAPYYLYRQKNTIGNLENVGYAKAGTENLYNIYIMDEIQTILACGAGGVTKMVGTGENPIRRVFNFKYHFEYISRFEEILSRKEQVRAFYEAEGK